MRLLLTAVIVCGVFAANVRAAEPYPIVQTLLSVDVAQHTWEVRLRVVDRGPGLYANRPLPGLGIQAFLIDVVGSDGINVVDSQNVAPGGFTSNDPAVEPIAARRIRQWGFQLSSRFDGNAGRQIFGRQETIYGRENDPHQDYLVQQGFGLSGGARYDLLTDRVITWDADLLVATGTYTGESGKLTASSASGFPWINLLVGNENWVGPGNVNGALLFPTTVHISQGEVVPALIPEPASIVLATLAALGLAASRRRGYFANGRQFQRPRFVSPTGADRSDG